VLYEMVTGRRAVAGKTMSETLAAVVRDQPKAPREVVPGIPEALERLILRCLRKEPERRFQHMSDVHVELREVKEESDSAAATPTAIPAREKRAAWGVAGLAVVLIAATGVTWLWRSRAVPLPPERVVPLTALPGTETWATFSPMGSMWLPGPEIGNRHLREADRRRGAAPPHPTQPLQPGRSPDGRQSRCAAATIVWAAPSILSPPAA
jgi:hypothetical protein